MTSRPEHRRWPSRRLRPPLHAPAALLAAAVGLLGCEGKLTSNAPVGDEPVSPGPVDVAGDVTPGPTPRYARLTHPQWENSVRDLLGLSEAPGLSETFPADPRTAGFAFDNDEAALQADQALSSAYARAAEALAEQVAASSSSLSRILPGEATSDRNGARAFVEQFGERAFRRPLTAAEIDAYLALYDRGDELYDDSAGFVAGMRILLEAFLQSPYFLYRIETSDRPSGDVIGLSGWEIGQRLSYLIVNSTPDDELLEAARTGALDTPEGVRRQAFRLLTTPRARPALVRFHAQLFEFEKFSGVSPSPTAYPDVTDAFGPTALESSERFVESLAFDQLGSFADLMTSTRGFVNDELAGVYGLQRVFGDELAEVDLPANQRAGILNQVGFLAANATSVNPDPIHRGVFIATRVLCRSIAAPPDGVPPLPPIAGGTNRQIVENHTQSSPVCRACHEELINPFGFAFENYDATGAYRTTDNGFVVDAAVSPIIDGERVDVENSVVLAQVLAASEEAHDCFAAHLAEYALGRSLRPADAPLVAQLSASSRAGTSIPELVVELAESRAFTTRSLQELP